MIWECYDVSVKHCHKIPSSCHILLDHPPLSQHWHHHVSYFPRLVAGTSWWRHTCMFPNHEKSVWMLNRQLKKLCFPEIGAGQFNQLSILHSTIRSIIFLSSQTYKRQAFHVVEAVFLTSAVSWGRVVQCWSFQYLKCIYKYVPPLPLPAPGAASHCWK